VNSPDDPARQDALRKLGFPDDLLTAATNKLGTLDVAQRWVEVLGPHAFEEDCIWVIPDSGFDPQEYIRWQSAGFEADDFPYLLPHLGTELTFDDALGILKNWFTPGEVKNKGPASELAAVLENGLTPADVRRLIAGPFSGHQVFLWSSTDIKDAHWPEWIETGLAPWVAKDFASHEISPATATEWATAGLKARDAYGFLTAGFALDEALDWAKAGVDASDVDDFIELGLTPSEAAPYAEDGIRPYQITRTDTGYEVELEPWQEDPVDQLPKVVEPGRFGLSVWSHPSWSDEPLENEVSIGWDGKHTIEWSVVSGSGLGMISSVSFSGIASWPNGKDVLLNYRCGDYGIQGVDELKGAAPNADGTKSADDPHEWVGLAQQLVWLARGFDDSGGDSANEYADEYYRPADHEWYEFDDMFRIFLDSAGDGGALPHFDDWLEAALEAGTYRLHEENI
jgi:hypothetical protein